MGVSARRFDIAEAGLGVLAESFPLETVQAILAATGREGKRKRLLPASMMVYYVIALGLFVGVGCREVLRRLLDGAMWIWPERQNGAMNFTPPLRFAPTLRKSCDAKTWRSLTRRCIPSTAGSLLKQHLKPANMC